MRKRTKLVPSLAMLALVGCAVPAPPVGGDASSSDATPGSDVAANPGAEAIRWTACTLHEDGSGDPAECAVMRVPLDAARPDGPTVEYYFKRYHPPGGRSLRALWMLQGGPGASGHVYEALSEAFARRFPDVDYYMPDHRGTGRSTRLSCPAQEGDDSEGGPAITESEWPACVAHVQREYGADLAHFNTTNAANDLGLAIRATRVAGRPTFALGISYGTYLAHRLMQVHPGAVDGVVLDSIVPQGMSLFRQDEDSNEAARDYFTTCGRDAFCGSKLGPDPWARVNDLFRRLREGHCAQVAVPGVETHVVLRRAFGGLLMNSDLRAYVAPIAYRFDRCNERDVAALRVLMGQLTQAPPWGPEQRLWGWVLMHNVAQSEFNETPAPTPALLEGIREGAVASRDVSSELQINLGRWPVYAPDRYAREWAPTTVPVLMLQGGLDPATLLRKAREVRAHLDGPNQYWVEFPQATHTTLGSTPFVDEAGETRSCGTRLLMRFIEDPTRAPDTACVDRVIPLDFRVQRPDINRALFGRSDAWE